jgi:predicted DNA-binding ribbon-helix-helix protein
MKSTIVKRSIALAGHKTSVSLEDAFWKSLREIARARGETVSALVGDIDANRQRNGNLSSAIRLYVLASYANRPDLQGGTQERFAVQQDTRWPPLSA